MKENDIKTTNDDEIETCVLCGKKTPYSKSMQIQKRFYYIVGVGQTCFECFKKLKSGTEFVESEE